MTPYLLALLPPRKLPSAPTAVAGVAASALRLITIGSTIYLPDGVTVFEGLGMNQGHGERCVEQDIIDQKGIGATWGRVIARAYGGANPWTGEIVDGAGGDISTGYWSPSYLTYLDNQIGWHTSRQVWVQLAVDSNGGQKGTTSFFLPANAAEREKHMVRVEFLTNRYKDTGYIASIEVMVEPQPEEADGDYGGPFDAPTLIRSLMLEGAQRVHAIDPLLPVTYGPDTYELNADIDDYLITAEQGDGPMWWTGNVLDGKANLPEATLSARLDTFKAQGTANNQPTIIQQMGSRTSSDPTDANLTMCWSLVRAKGIPSIWWEWVGQGETEYSIYWGLFGDPRNLKVNRLAATTAAWV